MDPFSCVSTIITVLSGKFSCYGLLNPSIPVVFYYDPLVPPGYFVSTRGVEYSVDQIFIAGGFFPLFYDPRCESYVFRGHPPGAVPYPSIQYHPVKGVAFWPWYEMPWGFNSVLSWLLASQHQALILLACRLLETTLNSPLIYEPSGVTFGLQYMEHPPQHPRTAKWTALHATNMGYALLHLEGALPVAKKAFRLALQLLRGMGTPFPQLETAARLGLSWCLRPIVNSRHLLKFYSDQGLHAPFPPVPVPVPQAILWQLPSSSPSGDEWEGALPIVDLITWSVLPQSPVVSAQLTLFE